MFAHYFKIAFRSLLLNKLYSVINIGGLALGLAACLLIGLYIHDEYSYDRFHSHFVHIYRVVETQRQPDGYHPVAVTPGPLAAALSHDFGEVEQSTRVGQWRALLQTPGVNIEPKATLIVENSFFKMFDFRLVLGDPNTVLQGPDELIITEALATQMFGQHWRDTAILGKTVLLNEQNQLRIVGVCEAAPTRSHLQFDALLPFKFLEKNDEWANKWNSNSYHTYLQLAPNADVAAFEKKIANQMQAYANADDVTLYLQALSSIYLYSKFDFDTDWGKRSDVLYVRIFLAVGLIVLLIAMFNFINLATSRAAQRAREVGVRKSVGAGRGGLIGQFLGESLLMSSLAVILALLLTESAAYPFELLTDKALVVPFEQPAFWAFVAGGTALIGLLTGIYPAFFLSAFRPAQMLKSTAELRSGAGFRKTLVVGQFALSVVLGIGTMVIYQQLQFIQHKKLGFDQSQLLYLRLKGEARSKAAILKRDISQLPGVASVSTTTSNLVDVSNTSNIEWEGQTTENEFLITQMNIDADFMATTGMALAAGRNFSTDITGDTLDKPGRFMVNETAARRMGYTNEAALGKKVKFWGLEGEIVGVLHDFHFRPLDKSIEPFIFRFRPKEFYFQVLVKTKPDQVPQTIAAIETIYRKLDANHPPDYGFVDQDLEAQYRSEQRTGQTVMSFSILALLLSCLGLLGLAAYTAERRHKEIGIRKVLGASIAGVTRLLVSDFLKLVVIGIVIASPVAYYLMDKWLANFAYRIDIQWWMFVTAALAAVAVAFLTISFQSVRAALANPVKSLRSE